MFCKTPFSGHSIRFSPFFDNRLAVATAQNFGIVGNGKLHVFEFGPAGFNELAHFDTQDGLYDCAWSEENESILVAASGDGSIKLYDLAASSSQGPALPLRSFQEHSHEASSVHWNYVKRDTFLSTSWDDSVKVWNVMSPASVATFKGHTYCAYVGAWNPQNGDVFLSASGDRSVKIWDTRQPNPTLTMLCHDSEILAADWNKYNDAVIATGSVDKTIRTWDVRYPKQHTRALAGHTYAVRRVAFSPHSDSQLASCSYDMTVRLWDTRAAGEPLLDVWDHHSEFAIGLDMSVHTAGLMGSTGWDELVGVWQQGTHPKPGMAGQGPMLG